MYLCFGTVPEVPLLIRAKNNSELRLISTSQGTGTEAAQVAGGQEPVACLM